MDSNIKVYKYRWVVLSVYLFINLTMQMLWITFAPITSIAADYYGVSELRIGFLSMIFMIAFIPFSIPSSWAIDKFGFKIAVSIGAVLMGIFALVRGFAGTNFSLVFWSTVGIAIAQPLLLNSWTTVPAKWFPIKERATAVGLVTIANLIGTGIGLVVTPVLVEQNMSISFIQLVYGVITAISSIVFILFAREAPPTPPEKEGENVRALMLDGLKHALKNRSFWIYLLISFLGLGIFNGITTWVEAILQPKGYSPVEAGTLGALMLVGGLFGAVILPMISDKIGRRKIFVQIGVIFAIPGLIGLAFFDSLLMINISAFWIGFFLISVGPTGMQYAAEITAPTPEGTSNGLIQLFGQGSVVYVYVMEALRTADGSFTPSLLLAAGLLIAVAALTTQMKEVNR